MSRPLKNFSGSPLSQSGYKGRKTNSSMQDKRLRFQRGKQREFLEAVIQNHFGTQAALARFLEVHKHTVKGWLHEENNMPKSAFQKIITFYPVQKHFEIFIEEELPWNWGWIKGGVVTGSKSDIYKRLAHARSFIKGACVRRLKKEDVPNLIVDQMLRENVDLKSILAVCLLTDGSLSVEGRTHRISVFSKDPVIVDFSRALFLRLSKFEPGVYAEPRGVTIVRMTDNDLARELQKLSPEFRTFPPEGRPQPTIAFLKTANEQTKRWAIKVALTLDGSISLSKYDKPELTLTCYNKASCEEWQELFTEFGIIGNVCYSKRSRQGAVGVRTFNYLSIYNFYKMGGFMNGVKISTKSTRFDGLEKNHLLRQVIQLGVQKGVLKGVGPMRFELMTSRSPNGIYQAGALNQTKLRSLN